MADVGAVRYGTGGAGGRGGRSAADREAPRVALLRRLHGLPLVETLKQPRWHALCDLAMADALRSVGLPEDRMTLGLEEGEFLDPGFAGLPADDSTVVIATRRSEEAVAGVLRRRGRRNMALFGVLLPRLAALSPARVNVEAIGRAFPPRRMVGIAAPDGRAADRLAAVVAARGNARVVRPFGEAQVALAEAQGDIGFDVPAWWSLLTRSVQGLETLVLRYSVEELRAFLAPLAREDAAFIRRALASVPVAMHEGEVAAYRATMGDAGRPGDAVVTVDWQGDAECIAQMLLDRQVCADGA